MTISPFGVDHGEISKADALGSTESILAIAHDRGEHAGKNFLRCRKCIGDAHKANVPKNPVSKRDFSAKARRNAAKSGDALPDGSFPIRNRADLHNAERLVGRSKHPEAAKRLIARRAKDLGVSKSASASRLQGPGSLRAKMSQSAWESQSAAHRRG